MRSQRERELCYIELPRGSRELLVLAEERKSSFLNCYLESSDGNSNFARERDGLCLYLAAQEFMLLPKA
jgi:hypothetical protein